MAWPKYLIPIAFVLAAIPAHARTYCCTDENHHRVCGDIVPAQCQSRAYNEFNSQGVLSRQYEAPLTHEQRVQRDIELARKAAEEHRAAEAARRDRALIASYSSVADLDAKRSRAMAGANAALKLAQERVEASIARKQKLEHDAERFRNKAMSENLKGSIRDNESELAARQATLVERQKELVDTQTRYDEDRQRYLQLTNTAPAALPAAPLR